MKITKINLAELKNKRLEIVELYNKSLLKFDYENHNKLSVVFNFWILKLINSVHAELPKNLPLNLLNIERQKNKIYFKSSNNYSTRSIFKKMVLSMLRLFPFGVYSLPGGIQSKIDSISYLILNYSLSNSKLIVNKELKKYFYSNINLNLGFNFPDFFFSKKIDTNITHFKGSPISILNSPWNKILFNSKKIFIRGFSHGGFYGELRKNEFEKFEVNISDTYYGWGFHKKNIVQNRFKTIKKKYSFPENILIVDRLPLSSIEKLFYGDFLKIYEESLISRNTLISKLNNNLFFLKHPRSPMNGKKYITLSEISKKENNLYLIDHPGQTFFYQAIYEYLPFIMFFKKEWQAELTDSYNKFLNYLHSIGLLFWHHEEDKFLNEIHFLFHSKKKYYFDRHCLIINYLKNDNYFFTS